MTHTVDYTELRKTARITGIAYLVVFVAGMIAEFVARAPNIIAGDAVATAANIATNGAQFRIGIAGDLIMIIADVALAMLFYQLLKPVSKPLAILAAMFRLAQAATLGMNLLNLYLVLELTGGAGYLGALGAGQLEALTLFFANAHGMGYTLGLLFFGVSLLLVGYLSIKAPHIPTVLGILLVVAAVGYLVDIFAQTLVARYEEYSAIFDNVVLIPAFIAELAMSLWLMIRGTTRRVHDPGFVAQPAAAR